MPIALVQDVSIVGDTGGAINTVNVIDISTSNGNTLTLTGSFYLANPAPNGIVSVTDSASNTWHYSTSNADNPPSGAASDGSTGGFVAFVAYSVDAEAVTSVTLTLPDRAGGTAYLYLDADCSEWSGVASVDTGTAGEGTATATSPGTITLTGSGELVVGANDHLSGTVSGNPAGATELSSATGLGGSGYEIFGSSGSQTFQWTYSESSAYTVALLALVPSGSAGASTGSMALAPMAMSGSVTISGGSNTSTGSVALAPLVISASETIPPVGDPSGGPWFMVLNEGFTNTVKGPLTELPNPATWAYRLIWGDQVRAAEGTTDYSWASHNEAGVSVSDGTLSLIARFESPYDSDSVGYDPAAPNPTDSGNAASYTSGIATTAPGFACSYGYVEANISIPVGSDVWPSFFTVSRTGMWGPENDIMEFISGASTSTLWAEEQPSPSQLYHLTSPFATPSIDDDYHVWGMRWSPTDVTYFLDGEQYGTYTGDGIPDWPSIIQLVMQIPQSDTSDGFPCSLDIDYVRAWVVDGVPNQPVITSISPANGIPTDGTLTVNFNSVSGATSYRATPFPVDEWAYYLAHSDTNPDTPDPATGDSSPITITGFTNGVQYSVSVAAVNSTGYSIESLPVPALQPIGTASTALAPMAMSGTVTQHNTCTGSMALPPMGMDASENQGNTSTGSLALAPMAMSGTATNTAPGETSLTGGLALAPMAMSATASVVGYFTSTGSLALAPLVMFGGNGAPVPPAAFGTFLLVGFGGSLSTSGD